MMGVNNKLGWGLGFNRADIFDVFEILLNPKNDSEYFYNGQFIPFEIESYSVSVSYFFRSLVWEHERTVKTCKFGRIFHCDAARCFAFRSSLFARSSVSFLTPFRSLTRATSFPEFLRSFSSTPNPATKQELPFIDPTASNPLENVTNASPFPFFNFVYADENSTLFYSYQAKIPQRHGK